MQNKVKVVICGKEYVINTDEVPSYVISLAKRLDNQMNAIMDSSDNIPITTAAVLTALSALDEAHKANMDMDRIRVQIKDYVDDAHTARADCDEKDKEIALLRTKIVSLENELKIKKLSES